QDPSNHSISFMDVSFAYTENNPVLRQVNFDVKPNSITAIVGPSGAGKSTIAQLLSRFWDCSMGNIYIGGIDIRSFPTEQLMQLVSYVFQDSFMFQQSLYDNIAMGMDKTRQEVEDAA